MTMIPSRLEPAITFLQRPAVSLPASALLAAGLSAYGNALDQNQLEKGDARLIMESALAGGGSLLGQLALAGLLRQGRRVATALPEEEKARIRAVLQANPELPRLRRAAAVLGEAGASHVGAGFAGGVLAPFIAANLNLFGVPGFSGRQQDFYEEDQPVVGQGVA